MNRQFHREFLKRKAPEFSQIISDVYGKNLSGNFFSTGLMKIKRKYYGLKKKKKFFKGQLFWGIDQETEFLRTDLYDVVTNEPHHPDNANA